MLKVAGFAPLIPPSCVKHWHSRQPWNPSPSPHWAMPPLLPDRFNVKIWQRSSPGYERGQCSKFNVQSSMFKVQCS